MTENLDEQLNGWLKKVTQKIPSTEDTARITEAGAKVLSTHLKNEAEKHRTKRNDVKFGHLADNLIVQDTDIDGEKNGNSVVGFSKKAFVARFLNDGTVKMKATHFVDNARRDAQDAVFEAEQAEYERITGGDD